MEDAQPLHLAQGGAGCAFFAGFSCAQTANSCMLCDESADWPKTHREFYLCTELVVESLVARSGLR